MLQMRFTVHDADVETMLKRLELVLSPAGLTGFMASTIGPYLQQRAKARFQNEGDDVVGHWAPLKETTHSFRLSQGFVPDHPINHRTGRLENYITGTQYGATPTSTGGAEITFPKNPPRGETAAKLKTAQFGKAFPQTPPRPVLGINERDMAFAVTALHAYIHSIGLGGHLD